MGEGLIMRKPELLAPAKNTECLKKVIDHGADSVYMGYPKHNARMFGKNFSLLEFKEGISYAHSRGVKVYLTLNTLIKEHEITEAIELARRAVNDGVDGILVQDLGLAMLIRNSISQSILHASTQLSISNHYGVAISEELGFTRVVLARELNSGELISIKQLIAQTKKSVEIEAFIHGGLCIAYSGQCFASSYCYSSSANRGMCKMPCWDEYTLVEEEKAVESGNSIRPKDLCGIYELGKLLEGGIDCFKIQGRLRNVTYISEVVDVYRKCIDLYRQGLVDTKSLDCFTERLIRISPRGLTTGNLSETISEDMVILEASRSEKAEEVSGDKPTIVDVLGNEQLATCGVKSKKEIAIFLHRLDKSYPYLSLTQDITRVYIPLREFLRVEIQNTIETICQMFETFLYMPPMIYERNCVQCYNKVEKIFEQYDLKGAVLSNISDFVLIKKKRKKNLCFFSGNNLHVMNSFSAEQLNKMGIERCTLSVELPSTEAKDITINTQIPLEQIVYGHPELLHTKYCLLTKRNECGNCTKCKEDMKKYYLKGKHKSFEILFCSEQTECILYSTNILSVPTSDWIGDSVRMDFLWETPSEINKIVSLMNNGYYYFGGKYMQLINID